MNPPKGGMLGGSGWPAMSRHAALIPDHFQEEEHDDDDDDLDEELDDEARYV